MIRIKVDLSNLFDDHRKYAYVIIHPDWKTVKCVQDHIRDLFKLQKIVLLIDQCYLHPSECINVISEVDTISVIQRKKSSPDSSESEKCKKEKKNNFNVDLKNNVEIDMEPFIPETLAHIPKRRKISEPNTEENNIVNAATEGAIKVLAKKKRKRSRKKKPTKNNIDNSQIVTEISKDENSLLKSNKSNSSLSHIKFDDNGEALNDEIGSKKEKDPIITFKNSLDPTDQVKARIITATVIKKEEESNREVLNIPNVENISQSNVFNNIVNDNNVDHKETLNIKPYEGDDNAIPISGQENGFQDNYDLGEIGQGDLIKK